MQPAETVIGLLDESQIVWHLPILWVSSTVTSRFRRVGPRSFSDCRPTIGDAIRVVGRRSLHSLVPPYVSTES
jgi:hypothetical protein